MKTLIAALALVLFAAGPTFAGSHTRYLQEGRYSAYVSQSGYDTGRESMIHAN